MNVPVLSTFTYCNYEKLFFSFTTFSFDGYKIVPIITYYFKLLAKLYEDLLYGLVVRVPGYRSRGRGSIPGANRFSEK
jgi:hypothetical protein